MTVRKTLASIAAPFIKSQTLGKTKGQEGTPCKNQPCAGPWPKILRFCKIDLGGSDDFYTKKLSVGGIRCAIIMFTGISSPEKLCRLALDMLDRDPAFFGGGPGLCDYLLKQSLIPAEPQPASNIEEIGELLANGMSLLLIDDCDQAVVFSTQEMPQLQHAPQR